MSRHEPIPVYEDGPDPSEKQGYQQIFQKEIPIRIQTSFETQKKTKPFQDLILFRLFVTKTRSIKIQLTSQVDVLFLFIVTVQWQTLQTQLREKQITIKFNELSIWWRTILESKDNVLNFERVSDFQGVLSINQKLPFKIINVLNLVFIKTDHETLKENIMYRYQRMMIKKGILSNILMRGNMLIKVKNPSLLNEKPKMRIDKEKQREKQKYKQKQKQFRFK